MSNAFNAPIRMSEAKLLARVDESAIQQVLALQTGETCHEAANIIGSYRASVREFGMTRDAAFLTLAVEAERELRIFLTKLRLRQAGLKPLCC